MEAEEETEEEEDEDQEEERRRHKMTRQMTKWRVNGGGAQPDRTVL